VLTFPKQQLEPTAQSGKVFMARIIPRKEHNGEAVKASSEVDFALVLSRTISSVIADPEQLRTTVDELARHKFDAQEGATRYGTSVSGGSRCRHFYFALRSESTNLGSNVLTLSSRNGFPIEEPST
jgi:hypothetical protein